MPESRAVGVYREDANGGFSLSFGSRFDVFRHLLRGPRADIWHFFFAPNRKSAAASRFARAARRVPCIQTMCSLPAEDDSLEKLLFADVTVALSDEGFARLAATRVGAEAIRQIPPSVPPLQEPDANTRVTLRKEHRLPVEGVIWIYPGDLEHGDGARIALDAFASSGRSDEILLIACRDKTPRAGDIRAELTGRARTLRLSERVRWMDETPFIHELLALSDFVVLPAKTSFAKMDYPLVALEAMCMARPVLVSSATPARELGAQGAAWSVEPSAEALADAVSSLRADDQARRALGARARRLVLDQLSPACAASAYEKLYDEIHG